MAPLRLRASTMWKGSFESFSSGTYFHNARSSCNRYFPLPLLTMPVKLGHCVALVFRSSSDSYVLTAPDSMPESASFMRPLIISRQNESDCWARISRFRLNSRLKETFSCTRHTSGAQGSANFAGPGHCLPVSTRRLTCALRNAFLG